MSTATLTFDRVRADDDAALREWFDLRRAVQDADLPGDPELGLALHAGMPRHPWPGSENRVFQARRDGVLLGWLGLGLPQTENLGTVTVDIEVGPAYRRQIANCWPTPWPTRPATRSFSGSARRRRSTSRRWPRWRAG